MTTRSQPAAPETAAAVAAPLAPTEAARTAGLFRRIGSYRTFDALNVPAFRWYFLSTLGQLAAFQSQAIVAGYIVYELTGSYAKLGLVNVVNAVPALLVALHAGVLSDRLSKRLVLQVTQVGSLCISLLLAIGLLADVVRYEHMLVAAALQGVCVSFMMPARHSMTSELVDDRQLMNAVSLNTAGITSMRLFAPGFAGLVLAMAGAGWVYFVISACYTASIVFLFPIPRPQRERSRDSVRTLFVRGFAEGAEGLRYLVADRRLLLVLTLNMLMVAATMPYMHLLAGFVKDVLDAGALRFGILGSITGVGSLAGSLVIASLPSRGRGKLFIFSAMLLGAGIAAFAISTNYYVSAVLLLFVGAGHAARMAFGVTLLQSYTKPAYRGRVMSLYNMEFSLVSFAVFGIGLLAEVVGVQWAIGGTAGALVVLSAVTYFVSPTLRDLD